MLGGGVFTAQNKKLPGAYINFVSVARASATLSDRGICALPMELSWGNGGEIIPLEASDFLYNARKILGYDYGAPEMIGLREVFKNASKVFVYKLNKGEIAENTYCKAAREGARGNDLRIVISSDPDREGSFIVKTLLDLSVVDSQNGKTTDDLEPNDFIVWKAGVALAETASTPLAGGEDGTVTAEDWSAALAALESESFNTLGIVSTDEAIKDLAVTWTKQMREERGVKFQTVVHNKAANYEGVINLVSSPIVGGVGVAKVGEVKAGGAGADLVYWVTGAQAGCKVNASCTNKKYDGEFAVDVKRTQAQLEDSVTNGEFVFHKVGDEVRVLTDIDSLVDTTAEKGEDFKSNQTIRVIDQLATDSAAIFNNKYLGKIPNNEAGRISLWSDLVSLRQQLQNLGAIEGFLPEHLTVEKGETKKSVVVDEHVMVINALEQLYMTSVVA